MMGRVKTMSSLSLATLMTVLDTLPNAVFVKGADLRFTFINRAYEKMFGVSRKDVLGKTVLTWNTCRKKTGKCTSLKTGRWSAGKR